MNEESAPYPYDEYNEQSAKQLAVGSLGGNLRTPPVRKIVEQKIVLLEAQLKAHKDLLATLDENPGVENVLDKLRKIGI